MDKILTLYFEGTTIGYIKYTLKNGITLETFQYEEENAWKAY